MSMENIWNQPYYEAKIDIRGNRTNLTMWQTLVHYQTNLEMDKEASFPSSGIYHSQQYHSCLLWFRTIILTVRTDGEGPITGEGESALNLDNKARKMSPIYLLTKQIWHDAQQTVAFGREENWVPCMFPINKATRRKFKCSECNMVLCVTPCFKICHTKLHLWGLIGMELEKQSTQT
jgi:hypothetical protein